MILDDDPFWYKDAIIYQLHVKTFYDSDGDGIGDFRGLTEKLDYLQNLGVTAVWLLPFYPSPLKDDGYDISDYTEIHAAYGSLRDFRVFLKEAHRRGLRVITELVVNHTSDQHPWFQRARRAKPGSNWRNFYVWSDTPNRYREARIIFKDFESSNWAWDPVAESYYWHRFYSHQPDLNYDNPQVHKAVSRALDFWFRMGVDGLRLDAVPYLYERDGTNCENLAETHEYLKKLRSHVDHRYRNRMFLGEANQWPEDAAAYFGRGDEVHMAFHFPLMPRLFMALRQEDRFPILDILDQTPDIPKSCQWAVFLRNHDELTLEMVTDEERDYMYRVYAQDPQMRINLGIRRRLAPLLGNHRRRIELMNGLLLSIPGTPVIYYGDEIGMGDNIYLGDRNGVRTPMQWSADRNAGFSRANPHQLYLPVIIDPEYHFEVINVQSQQNNIHSFLWWMKRLIALRKRFKAFSRGDTVFLRPMNPRILAFVRGLGEERILVVANLSRFVQYAELDLSAYKGAVPVEIFGRAEFPAVGENPYPLTMGPHAFYWFFLRCLPSEETVQAGARFEPPAIGLDSRWEEVFSGQEKAGLEAVLPTYLQERRWFGGKARGIKLAAIIEVVPLHTDAFAACITFIRVEYLDGDSEVYLLPLSFSASSAEEAVSRDPPHAVLARLRFREGKPEGILYDPMAEPAFATALLDLIARRYRRRGGEGEMSASLTPVFRQIKNSAENLEPNIVRTEQSNTSVTYGQRFILKIFRRIQPGINPDLEIGRFLTERGFAHMPPVAGAMEYRKNREEPSTLAVLQGFVANQGDAWTHTLDILSHYFENIVSRGVQAAPPPGVLLPESVKLPLPEEVSPFIGAYAESARLLGERTAELHLALASAGEDRPDFVAEPFSRLYQRSLYQSMRTLTGQNLQLLRHRADRLPADALDGARNLLDREMEILGRFRSLLDLKITAMRIRCHGDFHLGQVLFTGKDFVIIDFEGEPARPITERRIKRSPLRDVAGMLRSFHYVVYSGLLHAEALGLIHPEDYPWLESWADFWQSWVCAIFLKSYLEVSGRGSFLPETEQELQVLLDTYLLEKAVYELGYELNNRPDWVKIPIRGIRHLLGRKLET